MKVKIDIDKAPSRVETIDDLYTPRELQFSKLLNVIEILSEEHGLNSHLTNYGIVSFISNYLVEQGYILIKNQHES